MLTAAFWWMLLLDWLLEIKMRDQSWGQLETRSMELPASPNLSRGGYFTLICSRSLAKWHWPRNNHHLTFLEGRKDGRQKKKKGISKGKAWNMLSNQGVEFSALEVFLDRLNRQCQERQQGEELNDFLMSFPSLPRTNVGNGLALRVYARSQKAILKTHLPELFLHWGRVSLLHPAQAHSYLFYGPSRASSPCHNPEHQHQSTCRLTSGFWGPLKESRIKHG